MKKYLRLKEEFLNIELHEEPLFRSAKNAEIENNAVNEL